MMLKKFLVNLINQMRFSIFILEKLEQKELN